jgi:hypothetical protein
MGLGLGLLKHVFRFTFSWRLKSIFQASMLICHAGSAGDRLLGPCFIPPRLTGAVYHHFLLNFLPELLQDVDLQSGVHLWFMPDGAPRNFHPAGFRKSGLDVVDQQLGLLVLPGLNRSHFCLRRHLKSNVCATYVSVSKNCNDDYRMDLRCFVLRLEFSSERGSRSADLHRRAL